MDRKAKTILGVSLIVIGLIWLLNTLGITIISYSGFSEAIDLLWPLVFVVIGLTIIFPDKIIKVCVWGIFVLLILTVSVYETQNMKVNNNTHYYYNDESEYMDF